MLTPLFLAIGLPAEGIGILIAVDVIPDTFATVLNVTGDLAAATLVAARSAGSGNDDWPTSSSSAGDAWVRVPLSITSRGWESRRSSLLERGRRSAPNPRVATPAACGISFRTKGNVRLSIESIRLFEHFEGTPSVRRSRSIRTATCFCCPRQPTSTHSAPRSRCSDASGSTWSGSTPMRPRAARPGSRLAASWRRRFCAARRYLRSGRCHDGISAQAARRALAAWTFVSRRQRPACGTSGSRADGSRDQSWRGSPRGSSSTQRGRGRGDRTPGGRPRFWIEPLRRNIFLAELLRSMAGGERGGPGGGPAAPDDRIMVIDFASSFYFHREVPRQLLFGMGDPDERPSFDSEVEWGILEKIGPVAAHRLLALPDLGVIMTAWGPGSARMTPDAMPIIGPAGLEGFHAIAGFSGHGFQHAPAAGRIVADVIAGRDPQFDLGPYRFDRFAGVAAGEANVV